MENKGRNKSFTNSGALILLPITTTECRIPKPRFFYLKAGTLTTKAKNNTLKTLTNLLLGFSLRLPCRNLFPNTPLWRQQELPELLALFFWHQQRTARKCRDLSSPKLQLSHMKHSNTRSLQAESPQELGLLHAEAQIKKIMSSDTIIWLSSCMWARATFTSAAEKGSGLSRLMDSIMFFRPTDWAWEALNTSRRAALNTFNLVRGEGITLGDHTQILPLVPSPGCLSPSPFQQQHSAGKPKTGAGSITDAPPAWDNSLEPLREVDTQGEPPLTLAQPTPASSLRQLQRLRVFSEGVPELEQKKSYLHPVPGVQAPREQKYWAQDRGG